MLINTTTTTTTTTSNTNTTATDTINIDEAPMYSYQSCFLNLHTPTTDTEHMTGYQLYSTRLPLYIAELEICTSFGER